MAGFAVTELVCRRGLHQIVNPGGPATERALGDLFHLQPRNPREQLPRLRAHFLGVLQMAGIVVGYAHVDWMPFGARP